MADFETEEQQVEALKKWFSENAVSLFLGIGIGLGGLFGWRYYIEQQNTHLIQASEMYQSVTKQISGNAADKDLSGDVEQLVAEYDDTPYASLAALAKARYELNSNDTDAAVASLDQASGHAAQVELQHIADLRKARLLIAQEKYEEAEQLLMQPHPQSFNALYEELKGDLYVAMGDSARARQAYDSAIEYAGIRVEQSLKLKRSVLGDADQPPANRSGPSI